MTKLRDLERLAWLERARAAKSDEEVLVGLVAAWRAAPAAELHELIDVAGTRAARDVKVSDQEAWLAAAARHDACELPALLASVQTGRLATSRERAEALATWPPDPRIAPGLLALCLRSHFTGRKMGPFWTLAFRIVHRQFHPGIATVIGQFDEAGRGAYVKLSSLRRRLASANIEPIGAEAHALCEALRAKLEIDARAAAAKSVDDFLREVWAAPQDDGVREVLADFLGDDPRAELIMLQLTRKRRGLDIVSQKREAALLEKHGRSWLGPLEPVIDKRAWRFEGGFVYACKVDGRALESTPALMTHPAWSTVREYQIDARFERTCDPWLDHMIALGAKRR